MSRTVVLAALVSAVSLALNGAELIPLEECKTFVSDQLEFGEPLVMVTPPWPRRTKKSVDEVCAIVSYQLGHRNDLLYPAEVKVLLLSDDRAAAFAPIAEGAVLRYAFHPADGMHAADGTRYISRVRFFRSERARHRIEKEEVGHTE